MSTRGKKPVEVACEQALYLSEFRASHSSSHNGGSASKVFSELAQVTLLAQLATLNAEKRTKSKLNPHLASR